MRRIPLAYVQFNRGYFIKTELILHFTSVIRIEYFQRSHFHENILMFSWKKLELENYSTPITENDVIKIMRLIYMYSKSIFTIQDKREIWNVMEINVKNAT